ncbi:hypothetical protein EKK58_02715 [Candidatus Dependentiae bacterium]|nr:MAG: hypothetical protein EKK58_02715 [Candidatus Dependentiae bacterium]
MLTLPNKTVLLLLTTTIPVIQYTASYFSFRSPSRNSARQYALWQKPAEQNKEKVSGKLSLIGQWSENFSSDNITKTLFRGIPYTKENDLTLTFAGSLSENKSENSFLADYFYLPTDFSSAATIKPRVKMFVASPAFRINLDAWHQGLYLAINSSFVHMKTDIHFKETIVQAGVNNYKQGYFVPDESLKRFRLLENATSYFNGNSIENDSATVFEPLKFAQIPSVQQKHNGVAETYVTFGYDHMFQNKCSIGIAGHVGLPTGNRVHGKALLEPTVGNGHHWELGGSINGNYTAWENEEKKQTVSFIGDIYIGHLFKCQQTRVFDLLNRPLSRYMLAMVFEPTTLSAQTLETSSAPGSPTGSVVPYQFAQHYMPLANATALAVDVCASIQTDIVGMIQFKTSQWSFNIGANVWCKSKDKLSFATPPTFNIALKGDAQIYGYIDDSDTPVVLSATQSKATTFSGLRFTKSSTPFDISVLQNKAIDNGNFAVVQDRENFPIAPTQGLTYEPNVGAQTNTYIYTSNPPIFVTMNDLDLETAKTKGCSYKLFYNVQHALETTSAWKPIIGIGGEAEWGHRSSTTQSSLSQWSVWAHCSFCY